MSKAVLENAIGKALLYNGGEGMFCWHGGEPTLAGADFFEAAVECQKKNAGSGILANQIQTNATAVTAELANFFHRERFGVGVSLDGPEHMHDRTRVGKKGGGTYTRVLKGVEILRTAGVDPSVICTVSRGSLPYPEEIFLHLVGLGFRKIHFSVVFDSKIDTSLKITNEEWYSFLRTVFISGVIWVIRR